MNYLHFIFVTYNGITTALFKYLSLQDMINLAQIFGSSIFRMYDITTLDLYNAQTLDAHTLHAFLKEVRLKIRTLNFCDSNINWKQITKFKYENANLVKLDCKYHSFKLKLYVSKIQKCCSANTQIEFRPCICKNAKYIYMVPTILYNNLALVSTYKFAYDCNTYLNISQDTKYIFNYGNRYALYLYIPKSIHILHTCCPLHDILSQTVTVHILIVNTRVHGKLPLCSKLKILKYLAIQSIHVADIPALTQLFPNVEIYIHTIIGNNTINNSALNSQYICGTKYKLYKNE